MRKLISMMMTCTLLLISTMPTVSWAVICGTPSSEMGMEALMESQNEKQHPQNMQEAMAMDDAQTCRIECGCGCHQHMDSLPHLLSPHLISQVAGIPANPAFERAENLIYSFFSYTPSVQLPPPNVS